MTFNPHVLPKGVELSADPVLQARSTPYVISQSKGSPGSEPGGLSYLFGERTSSSTKTGRMIIRLDFFRISPATTTFIGSCARVAEVLNRVRLLSLEMIR